MDISAAVMVAGSALILLAAFHKWFWLTVLTIGSIYLAFLTIRKRNPLSDFSSHRCLYRYAADLAGLRLAT